MAKFLSRESIIEELESLIDDAEEYIYIMTPFLKFPLDDVLYDKLLTQYESGISLTFMVRVDQLEKSDVKRVIHSMPEANLIGIENLHAKCYCNEDRAIITSMNFYEYSINHNWEMGVMINRESEAWEDAYSEIQLLEGQGDSLYLDDTDEIHYAQKLKISTGGVVDNPINLIAENPFNTNYKITMGVNIFRYYYKDSTIQLWDIGFQNKYAGFLKIFLAGSQGGIFFYDISDKNSLDKLISVMEFFSNQKKNCVVIGYAPENRSNSSKVPVKFDYAKELTKKYGCKLIHQIEGMTMEKMEEIFHDFLNEIEFFIY